MERLTARNERFPDETYYPYCFREDTCRGEGMSDKCDMCELPYKICKKLADYEDTGLTPEQIAELEKPIRKLEEHFGDTITVDQVIDFFVDFYVAQGDPERTEEALLLTNESVAKYRELKERDTAKKPTKDSDSGVRYTDDYICPNCGKHFIGTGIAEFCYHCGQRLKWEE